MMKEMTIYLIRHGKTRANIEFIYYGNTELPLEPEGIEELKQLKEQGIYPDGAQRYFTSGMIRTNQTIAVLYPDATYQIVPGLKECNLGEFEMKTHDEIKDTDAYLQWIEDKTGTIGCPGGEDRNEFGARVNGAFCELAEELEREGIDTAVIVFHGGPIVKVMQAFPGEEKTFFDWQPLNGLGYAVRLRREDGQLKIVGYTEIKEKKNE